MKRVKKPKKPLSDRPTKTPLMYVTQTNYVNLAIMVRVMYMCYGWRKKRLDNLCEAYVALIEEFGSRRSTATQFVRDTEELTGIDVKKLLDDAVRRSYDKN